MKNNKIVIDITIDFKHKILSEDQSAIRNLPIKKIT